MTTVDMLEAKTSLSRLVEALESGAELEIIIARNGTPAARLLPIARPSTAQRIGVAKGTFNAPDIDAKLDAEVASLFVGKPGHPAP